MNIDESKLYFIDFETGGLNISINPVCSCSIKKYNSDSKDFIFTPHKKVYNIEAFNINGFNIKSLNKLGTTRYNLIEYINFESLRKDYIILCGWYVEFDIKCLLNIYEEKNINLPIPIVSFDLMNIAKDNLNLESYSLISVYNFLFDDIEENKCHTSNYDNIMVERIYNKFKELKYI